MQRCACDDAQLWATLHTRSAETIDGAIQQVGSDFPSRPASHNEESGNVEACVLLSDFKDALKSKTVSDIVSDYLLSPGAEKVPDAKIAQIAERVCAAYGLESDAVKIHIVGSAKLGFSLVKKTAEDGKPMARFRPFSIASDIDVAVVSPTLFMRIWSDLSFYANAQPEMPWVNGHLGNYLLYGWLRPDHFPNGSKVASCRNWWELFGNLTAKDFGGRKVRGGLFINKSLLHAYQKRAVIACKDSQ